MNNIFSRHASTRMQQRGISKTAIELLFEFGITMCHRGAEIIYFNRRSLNKLIKSQKCKPQFVDKVKDNYLIIGNGNVVTVGHHFYRFKRDC